MFPEEYIRQCEKAVEVQEPWRKKLSENPSYADIFCQYVSGELIGPMFKSNKLPVPTEKIQLFKHFWLPHQDRLQNMVIHLYEKWGCDKWTALLDDFDNWRHKHGSATWEPVQLWLAFVMWLLYGKRWTGTDWQPAGEGDNAST